MLPLLCTELPIKTIRPQWPAYILYLPLMDATEEVLAQVALLQFFVQLQIILEMVEFHNDRHLSLN